MSAIWTTEEKRSKHTSLGGMYAPGNGKVQVLTCHTWAEYFNEVRGYTPATSKLRIEAEIKKSVTPDENFARKIERQRRSIRLGVSKFLSLNHWRYAVSGSKWDIGRVVAGHPDSAMRRIKQVSDRTVKILFCTEVQMDTHAEAVIIRAAALAELMLALDEKGIKTELIMGYATYNSGKKDFYESRVKMKTSNTPLNIGLLKYQLEGSNFLNVLEAQIIHNKFNYHMGGNPGMQCEADLVISDGHYAETSANFSTPEAAIEWVKNLYIKLGEGIL